MTILVTGSSGFIGKHLIQELRQYYSFRTFSLRTTPFDTINWEGIESVVHLAALVHQMDGAPRESYQRLNVDYPIELARRAKHNGVNHFVFISSVKVYGERSQEPFTEYSPLRPEDDYGKSKCSAEKILKTMESQNFKVSIIRVPVVYGPGVGGNILRLLRLVDQLPILPFGCIKNSRSMVYVGNLTAMIKVIIDQKAQGVFLASDQEPISTTHLIKTIAHALGKKKIFCATGFEKVIKLFKPALHQRLYADFEIENSQTRKKLNFSPPYSTEDGIRQMVNWYLKNA